MKSTIQFNENVAEFWSQRDLEFMLKEKSYFTLAEVSRRSGWSVSSIIERYGNGAIHGAGTIVANLCWKG